MTYIFYRESGPSFADRWWPPMFNLTLRELVIDALLVFVLCSYFIDRSLLQVLIESFRGF